MIYNTDWFKLYNQSPINREDIVQTLAKRNILRQVKTKQIFTNIKFISIKFNTPTTTKTCLGPLTLKDNFSATFTTDYKNLYENQKSTPF